MPITAQKNGDFLDGHAFEEECKFWKRKKRKRKEKNISKKTKEDWCCHDFNI